MNQISRARNAGAARGERRLAGVRRRRLVSRPRALRRAGEDAIAERPLSSAAARRCASTRRTAPPGVAVAIWNAISRAMRWAAGSFVFCEAGAFARSAASAPSCYAAEEIDFSRRLKRLGRLTILHRHPLRTSGRKVRLYSKAEYLKLLARIVLSWRPHAAQPGRVLRLVRRARARGRRSGRDAGSRSAPGIAVRHALGALGHDGHRAVSRRHSAFGRLVERIARVPGNRRAVDAAGVDVQL